MFLSRRGVMHLAIGAASSAVLLRAARADASPVGVADDIINDAWHTPPQAQRIDLELDDPLIMNEVLETGEESALVVRFADKSVLTLGENSSAVIDSFVYDEAAGSGSAVLSLTAGFFRFLSGAMPKENVTLTTPTVSIGIRGTELIFTVENDGATEMSTLAGEALCRSRISGRELIVGARRSARAGGDGRWQDGVRDFVHRTRSIAIDDGFEEARRRWRIRRRRQRRRRGGSPRQ